jgi:hypothetical protein
MLHPCKTAELLSLLLKPEEERGKEEEEEERGLPDIDDQMLESEGAGAAAATSAIQGYLLEVRAKCEREGGTWGEGEVVACEGGRGRSECERI